MAEFTLPARSIPVSGEAIPVIGLGTWQTFDVPPGPTRQPLEAVLRAFVELGGRLVDSSPMYGRSEEALGDIAARTGLLASLFLATKVWTTGRLEGIRQMEDSMRKLRSDRIDLMQVHNMVDAAVHLDTLRGWKREGRIRYLGVTHYTAAGQEEIARFLAETPVDFVQINYSAVERDAERRLLPLAQERGAAVIVNRPFATGSLLRRLEGRTLPDWAEGLGCRTWAQVLLKFVLSHRAVTCVIPATSRPEHVRENMVAAAGTLPDERLRGRIAAAVA